MSISVFFTLYYLMLLVHGEELLHKSILVTLVRVNRAEELTSEEVNELEIYLKKKALMISHSVAEFLGFAFVIFNVFQFPLVSIVMLIASTILNLNVFSKVKNKGVRYADIKTSVDVYLILTVVYFSYLTYLYYGVITV